MQRGRIGSILATDSEHFGDILVTFEGQIGSILRLLETDREDVGRWGQIGSISGTSWECSRDIWGVFRGQIGSFYVRWGQIGRIFDLKTHAICLV